LFRIFVCGGKRLRGRNRIKRFLLRRKRRQTRSIQKAPETPSFQDRLNLEFERLEMEIFQQRTALFLTEKNDRQARQFII
jgi:hypothetical protein